MRVRGAWMIRLAVEVGRQVCCDVLRCAYLDDAMLQVPFSQIQRLEKRRLSQGKERSGR